MSCLLLICFSAKHEKMHEMMKFLSIDDIVCWWKFEQTFCFLIESLASPVMASHCWFNGFVWYKHRGYNFPQQDTISGLIALRHRIVSQGKAGKGFTLQDNLGRHQEVCVRGGSGQGRTGDCTFCTIMVIFSCLTNMNSNRCSGIMQYGINGREKTFGLFLSFFYDYAWLSLSSSVCHWY